MSFDKNSLNYKFGCLVGSIESADYDDLSHENFIASINIQLKHMNIGPLTYLMVYELLSARFNCCILNDDYIILYDCDDDDTEIAKVLLSNDKCRLLYNLNKDDDEDDENKYENMCDCCVKSWTDIPNEFGLCECWCKCEKLLRDCRYTCN